MDKLLYEYYMDKFVIVGGFLCFAADVFAIASLATPEWVVTEFAGEYFHILLDQSIDVELLRVL